MSQVDDAPPEALVCKRCEGGGEATPVQLKPHEEAYAKAHPSHRYLAYACAAKHRMLLRCTPPAPLPPPAPPPAPASTKLSDAARLESSARTGMAK